MSGWLIGVVGPSGVGKDSLIAALAEARPRWQVVRRAVTREADETEPFEPMSRATFDRRAAAGNFALQWEAHGLCYGIPSDVPARVRAGDVVIANLSRGILEDALATVPSLIVLSVTAPADVLAKRLGARGRETAEDIAARLSRPAPPLPEGLRLVEVDNGGPLERSLAAALDGLERAMTEGHVQ
ncbi:phosphonate metabolism protein/1,5-bisphosphokinase (PRPP-forming) PhnN [Pelagovum pacificum]|uniref:Ribose 1,5-bisphosphate phosphokinase PhnN n=1 Tax=Pelagovum pacificum TaxID=2588711 RepID=A0A5C5GES4_9RHOB|nr:phosphonate metabolism protein/1,5-bisphosphokinase (PRPP-forming) PhnN [Pelagovum pacificum]QQA43858.1 phosphonate metabolism protein/1,5-bisphosphokinase (PRPP-forming) PhnN [Pelagovum pacificum]TNY33010.1 phosphonate metabolism protein/1,5-bisphosphokinase (PRPP-forming) PhnN [Pelagovum pacificum]